MWGCSLEGSYTCPSSPPSHTLTLSPRHIKHVRHIYVIYPFEDQALSASLLRSLCRYVLFSSFMLPNSSLSPSLFLSLPPSLSLSLPLSLCLLLCPSLSSSLCEFYKALPNKMPRNVMCTSATNAQTTTTTTTTTRCTTAQFTNQPTIIPETNLTLIHGRSPGPIPSTPPSPRLRTTQTLFRGKHPPLPPTLLTPVHPLPPRSAGKQRRV